MTDIVERLRQLELRITAGANETCGKAADTITALRAENEKLRAGQQAAVDAELVEALVLAEVTLRIDGKRMRDKAMSALQNEATLSQIQAILAARTYRSQAND